MTNSCSLAKAKGFHLLQRKFKWNRYPTTVQMWLNNAKVSELPGWYELNLSFLVCRVSSFFASNTPW